MPHFYFDVCTNGVTVEDEDGLGLLNAATGRLEAVRTAVEIMRDRYANKAEPADVSIIVRDGSPEPACTAPSISSSSGWLIGHPHNLAAASECHPLDSGKPRDGVPGPGGAGVAAPGGAPVMGLLWRFTAVPASVV